MYLRSLFVLTSKDLAIEFRTKTLFVSAVTFAGLLVVLFGFSVSGWSAFELHSLPSILWVLIFIAGYLGLNRQDDKERWDGALLGALMAPIDRSVVFYARVLSNTLFMVLIELVLVPVFMVVLRQSVPQVPMLFIVAMVLCTLGFMALGTFLTSVASASNLREIVVPILLFPLAIPLFLAVQTITQAVWYASGLGFLTAWWAVLVGYAVLFLVMPGLLFEILVEV